MSLTKANVEISSSQTYQAGVPTASWCSCLSTDQVTVSACTTGVVRAIVFGSSPAKVPSYGNERSGELGEKFPMSSLYVAFPEPLHGLLQRVDCNGALSPSGSVPPPLPPGLRQQGKMFDEFFNVPIAFHR